MNGDLRAWLLEMVADAYHGKQPPHPFEECGDPFCADAYRTAVAIADVVDAARAFMGDDYTWDREAKGDPGPALTAALRRLDGTS